MYVANSNNRSNRQERIQMSEQLLLIETRELNHNTSAKRYEDNRKAAVKMLEKTFDREISNEDDELGITFQEEDPSSLFYTYFIYHQNTSDTFSSFQEEIFKKNIIRKSGIQKYPKLIYPSYNIIRYFSSISNTSNIINPYDIKIMHCTRKYNIEKEKPRNEEKIVDKLSDISARLKKVTHYSEKLQILDELNEFLNKHEDQIKKKFSDKLVSILNSL